MAAALAELHERQLVHRALSPRNVLFDREGRASFTGAGTGPGRSPARPGILPYAAPEQTGRTGRPADARADLYALGAIYFEMLTGAPPFGTPASLDLLHAHLAREPTPPDRLNPEVPEGLSALVLRLLAKLPEDRYQSARALLLDLEHAQRLWQRQRAVPRFSLGAQRSAIRRCRCRRGCTAATAPCAAAARGLGAGAIGRGRAGAADRARGRGQDQPGGAAGGGVQASGGQFVSVLFHVMQGTPLLDGLRAAVPGAVRGAGRPQRRPRQRGRSAAVPVGVPGLGGRLAAAAAGGAVPGRPALGGPGLAAAGGSAAGQRCSPAAADRRGDAGRVARARSPAVALAGRPAGAGRAGDPAGAGAADRRRGGGVPGRRPGVRAAGGPAAGGGAAAKDRRQPAGPAPAAARPAAAQAAGAGTGGRRSARAGAGICRRSSGCAPATTWPT